MFKILEFDWWGKFSNILKMDGIKPKGKIDAYFWFWWAGINLDELAGHVSTQAPTCKRSFCQWVGGLKFVLKITCISSSLSQFYKATTNMTFSVAAFLRGCAKVVAVRTWVSMCAQVCSAVAFHQWYDLRDRMHPFPAFLDSFWTRHEGFLIGFWSIFSILTILRSHCLLKKAIKLTRKQVSVCLHDIYVCNDRWQLFCPLFEKFLWVSHQFWCTSDPCARGLLRALPVLDWRIKRQGNKANGIVS